MKRSLMERLRRVLTPSSSSDVDETPARTDKRPRETNKKDDKPNKKPKETPKSASSSSSASAAPPQQQKVPRKGSEEALAALAPKTTKDTPPHTAPSDRAMMPPPAPVDMQNRLRVEYVLRTEYEARVNRKELQLKAALDRESAKTTELEQLNKSFQLEIMHRANAEADVKRLQIAKVGFENSIKIMKSRNKELYEKVQSLNVKLREAESKQTANIERDMRTANPSSSSTIRPVDHAATRAAMDLYATRLHAMPLPARTPAAAVAGEDDESLYDPVSNARMQFADQDVIRMLKSQLEERDRQLKRLETENEALRDGQRSMLRVIDALQSTMDTSVTFADSALRAAMDIQTAMQTFVPTLKQRGMNKIAYALSEGLVRDMLPLAEGDPDVNTFFTTEPNRTLFQAETLARLQWGNLRHALLIPSNDEGTAKKPLADRVKEAAELLKRETQAQEMACMHAQNSIMGLVTMAARNSDQLLMAANATKQRLSSVPRIMSEARLSVAPANMPFEDLPDIGPPSPIAPSSPRGDGERKASRSPVDYGQEREGSPLYRPVSPTYPPP